MTLEQRAQGQNGLPAALTPPHARTLEPLSDQGLARRLHHPGADRQSLVLRLGITHAVSIVAEVAQDLRDTFALGMLRTQMAQCPNHLRDTVVVVAQQMAILLELRHRLGVMGSIGRIEGIAEMLRGVEEVDELDALGQHATEERPVVVRSVGKS